MKKTIFFLLIFMLFGVSLFAENVLIYIKKADGTTFSDTSLPLAYAFEGGVMDEFFEAGHIIFNAGIKNISYGEDFSVKLAREEGAHFLLEIVLECMDMDSLKEASLIGADYRFLQIGSMKMIAEGTIQVQQQTAKETRLDISFAFGKKLARESLGAL